MPNVYLIKVDNAEGRSFPSCKRACRGHRSPSGDDRGFQGNFPATLHRAVRVDLD